MSSPDHADLPLSYIEVDLDAIAHNIRTLKSHVGLRVALMAVVKANAYGHGAVEVAQTALEHGAERLAVARTGEGVELRKAGITAPILAMSYTPPGDMDAFNEYLMTRHPFHAPDGLRKPGWYNILIGAHMKYSPFVATDEHHSMDARDWQK